MVKKLKDPIKDEGLQASGSWGKLEQVFEERVSRALGSIGVPTRQDIEALTRQVEQLAATVARLAGQATATPAAKARASAAAPAPAVKVAARKAAPRKPVAKKSARAPGTGA
jgi:hypothetical protein